MPLDRPLVVAVAAELVGRPLVEQPIELADERLVEQQRSVDWGLLHRRPTRHVVVDIEPLEHCVAEFVERSCSWIERTVAHVEKLTQCESGAAAFVGP